MSAFSAIIGTQSHPAKFLNWGHPLNPVPDLELKHLTVSHARSVAKQRSFVAVIKSK